MSRRPLPLRPFLCPVGLGEEQEEDEMVGVKERFLGNLHSCCWF